MRQAENDHRRRQRLPRKLDFARFRAVADSVGALLLVDMAHISGLVAAGLHPNPCDYADIVTSTTHKTLRGPRSGIILAKEKYGAAIDKTVFPGTQGGPLMHVIAAKAVCFLEAMQPGIRRLSKQVIANAQALAKGLQEEGFRIVSGGTDTHVMLVDVFSKGVRGREAEAVARPRAHHGQQERHPVRRQSAAEPERHPSGQPRRHHARLRRNRNARSRAR